MDRYDELEGQVDQLSPHKARAFLTHLAEQGDAVAQCLLADALDDGTLDLTDPVQSVAWYRLSAAQGYTRAEFYLGSMIAFGFGAEQNYEEAAHWLRKAASKNYSAAECRLGELLVKGLVTGTRDEGISMLKRAAQAGHEGAIDILKVAESTPNNALERTREG
jgi:TPR repeat protein